MHLLLLQLTALLVEEVGVVVDEVQVVAGGDGHCPAPSLGESSIGLVGEKATPFHSPWHAGLILGLSKLPVSPHQTTA